MPQVDYIQFGIVSPEEIKSYAVCEINSSELKGCKPNTLYDKRMGVNDNRDKCETCSQKNLTCQGHFGFINLAEPVIHPKFIRVIYAILRCVCFDCSACLISKEHAQLYGLLKYKNQRRIKEFIEICKKIKSCRVENCGAPVPNYRIKDNKIHYYYNKKCMAELDTNILYGILRKITNEDFQLLGFNFELGTNPLYTEKEYLLDVDMVHRHQIRPEWMILTVLPVLPPCARPSIKEDDESLDDHFIDLYTRIIKNNKKLSDSKKAKKGENISKEKENKQKRGRKKSGILTEKEYKETSHELEKCIWALIDNRNGKLKLPNGQPHKGLNERMSSKEGLVRKHIQGKRVNFTARTVAGGDPTLYLDQIIVPQQISKKITIPERVNNFNMKWLTQLINQHRAKFITRKNKRTGETTVFSLSNLDVKDQVFRSCLEFKDMNTYEYTVERHLSDNDPFIINRQPTLRLESMLGVKTVVLPGKTFRTNLSLSTPMNMDYDGDEIVEKIWLFSFCL